VGCSSGVAIVVLEQPAEALLAADADVCVRWLVCGRWIITRQSHQRPIVFGLVRASGVVMLDELMDEVVQVLLPEDPEVVEALAPQRLDEALGVGVEIG